MNIALEQTEEYVNGVVTNKYGDAFVRGNNGTFFSSSSYPLRWNHAEYMFSTLYIRCRSDLNYKISNIIDEQPIHGYI